jgi:hypothetical protein
LLTDASQRPLELDTARARSIVSPKGRQFACRADNASETRWGLGLDKEHFPQENIMRYSLIQYTGGPQYCLAILGFKVSLLASYLRVAGFNRTYAIALYVCIGLVTISQLIFTALHIASCSPIAKRKSSTGCCAMTLVANSQPRMGPHRRRQMHQRIADVLRARRHQSGMGCTHHSHALPNPQAPTTR